MASIAEVDGDWGPVTEAAAIEFELRTDRIRDQVRAFDVRSEAKIRTLALRAQREARLFLDRLLGAGLDARIISGTRTYAEQDELFAQGRTKPGRIVTNAPGGRSNHNFGIAWDIGLFSATGEYITEAAPYRDAAVIGKNDALEWGGDWVSFPDPPHYQLRLGLTLMALRQQFEAQGAPIALA